MKRMISVLLTVVILFCLISAATVTSASAAGTLANPYKMDVGEKKTLYLSGVSRLYSASWVSNGIHVSVTGFSDTAVVEVLSYSSLKAIVTCNYYYWQKNTLTGADHLLSGSKSYYIEINAPTYTVTFSSGLPKAYSSSKTVTHGSAIGTLPSLTADGYTFNGWYSSSGNAVTESTTVTSDLTLTARWTQKSSPPVSPTSPTEDLIVDSGPVDDQLVYRVLSDGTAEIIDYIGAASSLTIPSKIDGYTVTSIGYAAFKNCNTIANLTIPDTVTAIGKDAFYNCDALLTVKIPATLKTIGDEAFYSCDLLRTVSLPSTVTSFGTSVFKDCKALTSAVLKCRCTIGESAFENCTAMRALVLDNGIKGIGANAFSSCSALTSVNFPSTVTGIGDGAFSGCIGLSDITIPDTVTVIGNKLFYNCYGLESVTIPSSITNIGSRAFYRCGSLKNLTIPSSVQSIGEFAFWGCDNLESVHIFDLERWCSYTFANSGENPLWYAHNLYLNNELVTNLVIPESVSQIQYSFNGCTSITSITFPPSVTAINNYAFLNCTNLRDVTILNPDTTYGYNALGYYQESGYKKVSGFTIKGYNNSTAQAYAEKDGFTFVSLGEMPLHTVSGNVSSYLDSSDPVKVMLVNTGNGGIGSTETVYGNSATFSFTDVPDGDYTLTVSKKNHVTRAYAVNVSGDTTVSAQINPIGDVNLNGRVQSNDAMQIYKQTQGQHALW